MQGRGRGNGEWGEGNGRHLPNLFGVHVQEDDAWVVFVTLNIVEGIKSSSNKGTIC